MGRIAIAWLLVRIESDGNIAPRQAMIYPQLKFGDSCAAVTPAADTVTA